MPPTRSSGRNTIATTMMPTPPNHCSIERHKRSPGGRSSSRTKTVEPVVVMPDIASKMASTVVASVAPIRNGSAPNSGRTDQTPVARRNVSCVLRRARTPLAQASASTAPVKKVISALWRKACQ